MRGESSGFRWEMGGEGPALQKLSPNPACRVASTEGLRTANRTYVRIVTPDFLPSVLDIRS